MIHYDKNFGSQRPADATEGHKITAVDGDKITIESTRYPFCFTGDSAQSTTASIIEFLPFNQDPNLRDELPHRPTRQAASGKRRGVLRRRTV